MKQVKHTYAIDENGGLVHISSVNSGNRHSNQYRCVGCGKEMIPRIGKVREKHFAHAQDVEPCSTETYLHKLAKRKFKEIYDTSDYFLIEYNQVGTCSRSGNCVFEKDNCPIPLQEQYDLKRDYDTSEVEKEYNGFVADVLLSDSKNRDKEPVMIEMKVTHECSEQKQLSGCRIIEIDIQSEFDIESIKHQLLTESDKVKFIGFERKSKTIVNGGDRIIQRFVLFGSGACYVPGMDDFQMCRDFDEKINKASILELAIDSNYFGRINTYDCGLVKALDEGIPFKNCMLCKYYRSILMTMTGAPFCCLSTKYGTPCHPDQKDANSCQYYRLNKLKIDATRNLLKNIPCMVLFKDI